MQARIMSKPVAAWMQVSSFSSLAICCAFASAKFCEGGGGGVDSDEVCALASATNDVPIKTVTTTRSDMANP